MLYADAMRATLDIDDEILLTIKEIAQLDNRGTRVQITVLDWVPKAH